MTSRSGFRLFSFYLPLFLKPRFLFLGKTDKIVSIPENQFFVADWKANACGIFLINVAVNQSLEVGLDSLENGFVF